MDSKKRMNQKGMTLIEIMIVLGIIGLIFGFVGPAAIRKWKEAQVSSTKIQIKAFEQSLEAYFLAHSLYPHTSQGLEALVAKPSVGKVPNNYQDGSYFKGKEIPKDPFGNPYRYVCEDYQKYLITSDGPDQTEGSEDDIKSE